MFEAQVYLKLLTFAKDLATRHFKVFIIFCLMGYAVFLNLEIGQLRAQTFTLFELLQKYKDSMIEMKDEHNKENVARMTEINEIWKAAFQHERMINENTRKIQKLNK